MGVLTVIDHSAAATFRSLSVRHRTEKLPSDETLPVSQAQVAISTIVMREREESAVVEAGFNTMRMMRVDRRAGWLQAASACRIDRAQIRFSNSNR